jgi:hypothetical protein
MRSLPVYLSLFLFAGLFSCKKLVENKQRDVLMDIITNGEWHVETFMNGTDSITSEFAGYNFKFNEDGTVIGQNDSVNVTGFWQGDINNYSIISAFPETAHPLSRLTGTWKIRDSALDYVAAEMTTLQGTMILHLRKNPI